MAVDVKFEMINGGELVDDYTGSTLVRKAVLTGLPTGSVHDPAVLFAARSALASRGVFLGASHPASMWHKVARVQYKGLSNNAVEASINYSLGERWAMWGDVVFSADAILEVQITDTDADGNPITVNYTPAGGATVSPIVELQVPKPRLRLLGTMRGVSQDFDFTALFTTYYGKTNATPWRGKAAHTFCVTGLSPVPQPDGTYTLNYEWIYKPEGWRQWAAFRNEMGYIPSDANKTTPNGYKLVNVTGSADYANIFLV